MQNKYHIVFYCEDKICDTNITLPRNIAITPKTLDDIRQIIKEQLNIENNIVILNWQKFDETM